MNRAVKSFSCSYVFVLREIGLVGFQHVSTTISDGLECPSKYPHDPKSGYRKGGGQISVDIYK